MSIPFNIVTGYGTTKTYTINSSTVYPISSYTGVPVTLSVDLDVLPLSSSNNFIVFSINDALLLKENNSVYNFPLPGVYKITLYTALSGEPLQSYTAYLTAYNIITDIVNPVYEDFVNNVALSSTTTSTCLNSSRTVLKDQETNAGKYSNPIYLLRYNTWQLCYALSAQDYKINLYCDNSLSYDLQDNSYYESKWFHLLPNWEFRDATLTTTIRSLSTDSTDLYLTYDGTTGFVSTVSSVNSIFTGTSGYNVVYFKDDIPSIYRPVGETDILYFTQDLKDVVLPEFLIEDKVVSKFESGLPIVNNSSTRVDILVTNGEPSKILVTYNGIQSQPISNILINGASYPLFFSPADNEGNILKYFPPLSAISLNETLSAPGTIKISILSADNNGVLGDANNSFSYHTYDSVDINVDTLSGFYITVLSADYTANFSNTGPVTNFYLSTYSTEIPVPIAGTSIINEPFCINPIILSAAALVRDNVDGTIFFLTGIYLLNYYPENIAYNIMKLNENFNYVDTLKSYALMPNIEAQTSLFDDFFAYVGGYAESSPNELGKKYYEKIANFNLNNADVDGANIHQLYGLFGSINYNPKNYDLYFPADLQRVLDLTSINFTRLIGSNTGFNSNYIAYPTVDAVNAATNLGSQLTDSSIISAGTNIIIFQYFNNLYTTITPTVIPCTTTLLQNYSASNPSCVDITFNGLSSYPLSGYQNNWNWGLPNVNWASITQQHNFYLQTPTVVTSLNKENSYLDWSNNLNTLSALQYNTNLFNYFTMSGGLIEQYIENTIRKGVGLL